MFTGSKCRSNSSILLSNSELSVSSRFKPSFSSSVVGKTARSQCVCFLRCPITLVACTRTTSPIGLSSVLGLLWLQITQSYSCLLIDNSSSAFQSMSTRRRHLQTLLSYIQINCLFYAEFCSLTIDNRHGV